MGCAWKIWVGGGLEAIGFLCVIGELVRIQWREFGTPEWLLRLQGRWQRLRAKWRGLLQRLRRQPPVMRHGSSSVSGGGGASTKGYGWQGMGPGVPDRLGTIERNLTTLHDQHKKATAKLHEQVRQLREDFRSTRSAIEAREQQREAERRSSLRTSMRLQIAATFFFLVGLGLTVWGSVTTC